jgi:hypothetical protein
MVLPLPFSWPSCIHRSTLEVEIEASTRRVFQNVVKRKSLGVARNSKNRFLLLSSPLCLTLLSVVYSLVSDSYFQSLARQADATGQDSIDQELDSWQFNSKTPVERLGYPIVGGVTELGLEVQIIPHHSLNFLQHLTDVDRKEVMIQLLLHPEIFQEVVSCLGHNYALI